MTDAAAFEADFASLSIDRESIDQLISSTGVEVPTVMWPTARILATDIVLGSLLADELPPEASFDAVLQRLTVFKEPQVASMLPDLVDTLLAYCEMNSFQSPSYPERIKQLRALFA